MLLRLTIFTCLIGLSASLDAQEPLVQDASKQSRSSQSGTVNDDSHSSAREVFFRTMRATRTHGAQDLTFLLIQKSVRDEVGLNDDGWREIRDLYAENRLQGEKLFTQLESDWNEKTNREKSVENLKSELSRIAEESDTAVWKILEKHHVTERLIGLFVQHRDASAVVNKLVAQKIGLDEARRLEVLEKREQVEREVFESASEEFREGARNPNMRRKIWEKVQQKIDMAISDELTSEHKSLLEKLQGEPFTFEVPDGPPPPPSRGEIGGKR